MRIMLLPLSLLALAACDEPADHHAKGADISIEARDKSDAKVVVANADGSTGRVSISTPIFSADLKLPKVTLGADDFDLNGIKLYPGSTVERIAVDASEKKGERSAVDVTFASPAEAAKVRGWFIERFKEKKMKVDVSDEAIAGKTDDGDDFVMQFEDAGTGASKGTIHIAG